MLLAHRALVQPSSLESNGSHTVLRPGPEPMGIACSFLQLGHKANAFREQGEQSQISPDGTRKPCRCKEGAHQGARGRISEGQQSQVTASRAHRACPLHQGSLHHAKDCAHTVMVQTGSNQAITWSQCKPAPSALWIWG